MGFASLWGNLLPGNYSMTPAPRKGGRTTSKKTAISDFDRQFEAFVAEQRKIKAEREAAKKAEEASKVETAPAEEETPIDVVAEEAYQAFVAEDKPKSKRKKKSDDVVEETTAEAEETLDA